MNKSFKTRTALLLLTLLCHALCSSLAIAGIYVDGTRVIYPSQKREVTIQVHNNGDTPSLVQAWLDNGDPHSKAGEAKVPFVIFPPLFRIDPNKGQTLRLVYTKEPLATDRETVFWLNVLDIPPRQATNPDQPNKLEFAFKHRMKVFFRPSDLPDTAATAPSLITWKWLKKGNSFSLQANNPTPFHVNLTQVKGEVAAKPFQLNLDMVPPFSTRAFDLSTAVASNKENDFSSELEYFFVNDYGGTSTGKATVTMAP